MATRTPEAAASGPRRLARGLTQGELAERCGTSIAAISHIKRGTKVPTLTTLVRLADALECGVTKLVEVLDRAPRASVKLRKG